MRVHSCLDLGSVSILRKVNRTLGSPLCRPSRGNTLISNRKRKQVETCVGTRCASREGRRDENPERHSQEAPLTH